MPLTDEQRERKREMDHAYYQSHKETYYARAKAWKDSHRGQLRATARARYAADLDKYRAKAARWNKIVREDPERNRLHIQQNVDAQRLRDTGISSVEYSRMFVDQGGVCSICGDPPGRRQLSADHDHVTGRPRKLLCDSCNIGLGRFREDPALLLSAHLYLITAER